MLSVVVSSTPTNSQTLIFSVCVEFQLAIFSAQALIFAWKVIWKNERVLVLNCFSCPF